MSSALTSLTRIAIMACRASGSLQCLRMAVAAGRTTMVDSPPAFVGNARVWTVVGGKPVVRGMTARTMQPKHARVEDRIAVAARAIRR